MKLKRSMLAAFLAALLALSGCSLAETGGLYSLPQPSKEYLQLQTLIDAEIADGCEYAAPTAGSQRQSVQFTDLDGDGTNEALAFLRNKELQPLVCVYVKKDDKYALSARILGDGSAVGRVEYADLDGDGFNEIVISWEAASKMQLLTAYALSGNSPVELFKTSCLDFQTGDMNSDGRADVVTLSLDESGGQVSAFSVSKRREVIQKTAKLSNSLKTADRFRIASIKNGVPAAFVEGSYNTSEADSLLTDIVVFSAGELHNITLDPATGDSRMKRHSSAYCTDIDGDGALDVPVPEVQAGMRDTSGCSIFDWYTYSVDGNSTLCASTCHCFSDGWFFTLPAEWRNKLCVRRTGTVLGEHAVILSLNESGSTNDVLTIYTLSDENRADRARLGERFTLLDSGMVIYAAEIDDTSSFPQGEDTRKSVKDGFHLITTDWITGAL